MTDPITSRFAPESHAAAPDPTAGAGPVPGPTPVPGPVPGPVLGAHAAPSPAHYPSPTPGGGRGNGLAVGGFVVALIGVVLCLIPIVNNVAFVLAAVGLVLGIIGLVKTRKGAPRKGLAVAAIVLAVVGGIGVIASQAFYGKVLDDVADSLDDTPVAAAPEAETTPADDTETTDEAADVAEPAPAEQGTRANPYPAGTTVSNAEWDLTLGTPREAWGEIQAENPFNDAPAAGTEYWIVPLSGTFKGEGSRAPWVDITVQFVGDDNVTYDGMDCGVIPTPILDVGELYAGGTFEANACIAVPAGAPGLFTLETGWFSEPVFFAK